MPEYVEITNISPNLVLVGDKYLHPRAKRRVLRSQYEAALALNPNVFKLTKPDPPPKPKRKARSGKKPTAKN